MRESWRILDDILDSASDAGKVDPRKVVE